MTSPDWETILEKIYIFEMEPNPLYSRDWNEEENLFIESVYDPFAKNAFMVNGQGSRTNLENPTIEEGITRRQEMKRRTPSINKSANFAIDLNIIHNHLYQDKTKVQLKMISQRQKKDLSISQIMPIDFMDNNQPYAKEKLIQKAQLANEQNNNIKRRVSMGNNSFTHSNTNQNNLSSLAIPLEKTKSDMNKRSQGSLSVSKKVAPVAHGSLSVRQLSLNNVDIMPSLNFSKKQMSVEELIKLFSETKIQGPIKTLNLSENGITDSGLKKILRSLVNLSFFELKLDHNSLDEHALDYLISFSNHNRQLEKVSITGNLGISDKYENVIGKIETLEEKGVKVITS